MTVYACAITTKQGDILCSRSYRPLPDISLHLSHFKQLIHTSPSPIQHNNLRYLSIHSQHILLLLLTSIDSNIFYDYDLLQLLHTFLTSTYKQLTTETIKSNSMDIILTLDHLISNGLYEKLNQSTLRDLMEMDSYEEKIQEAIAQNKMKEANLNMKARIKEMDKKKKESSGFSTRAYVAVNHSAFTPTATNPNSYSASYISSNASSANAAATASLGQGMQLGKQKHIPITLPSSNASIPPTTNTNPIITNPNPPTPPIRLHETINISTTTDNTIQSFSVKGELLLCLSNPSPLSLSLSASTRCIVKTHPNIDKQIYSNTGELCLLPSKTYPVGSTVVVARYSVVEFNPLMTTLWKESGRFVLEWVKQVECELELVINGMGLSGKSGHLVGESVWALEGMEGDVEWEGEMGMIGVRLVGSGLGGVEVVGDGEKVVYDATVESWQIQMV